VEKARGVAARAQTGRLPAAPDLGLCTGGAELERQRHHGVD
jgi:hypothetical protein